MQQPIQKVKNSYIKPSKKKKKLGSKQCTLQNNDV